MSLGEGVMPLCRDYRHGRSATKDLASFESKRRNLVFEIHQNCGHFRHFSATTTMNTLVASDPFSAAIEEFLKILGELEGRNLLRL
jgi:hypothetical protein